LLHSQQQLVNARATLLQTRVTLQTELLNQEALVTQLRRQHLAAKREYENFQQLSDSLPGLVAAEELVTKREAAAELQRRSEIATDIKELLTTSFDSRVAAQQEQVTRLESVVQFNEHRLASLKILAGASGVVADLQVEEGIWVHSGGTLARVDQLTQLKAEIQIPQAQAQDLALGQVALIYASPDTIRGVVARVDPAVQNGSVTIDIALPGEVPSHVRADLNVDGIVIIERLEGIMYMSRPGYARTDSRLVFFVVADDGVHVERRMVQLGRISATEVEVVEGLRPGEVVVLSDMVDWRDHDRLRLR